MAEYSQVLDLVLQATSDAFVQAEIPVNGGISPDTALAGSGGALDSLGLVRLVLDVEQRVEEQLGTAVILADDRAMSQRRSPFRTVESLARYIHERMSSEQ